MDKVNKLLLANFFREVYYPEWLANIVMVKKANGKWRICVNFTDLNNACAKDSFPLPRITACGPYDRAQGSYLYGHLLWIQQNTNGRR